jgi:hypothetical protein
MQFGQHQGAHISQLPFQIHRVLTPEAAGPEQSARTGTESKMPLIDHASVNVPVFRESVHPERLSVHSDLGSHESFVELILETSHHLTLLPTMTRYTDYVTSSRA